MTLQGDTQDSKIAFIAGLLIALLALPILENLKISNLLPWLTLFPCATVLGLYGVHRLSTGKFPVLFQLGKYGVVGILNTVLSAGIFNLFISLSNVSQGMLINLFAVVAFVVSVTNSFLWNKFWTFEQKEKTLIKTQYMRFFSVNGTVTIFNLFLIHIGINTIGAPANFDATIWANIIFFLTMPVSFLGNFFGYRRFVFCDALKTPETKPKDALDKSQDF